MGRAPFELRPGEVVGGYTIERAIGRGGSASVYRATHPSFGQPVAFKVMHEHDPSGVGRPRFAREAALLKKLRHPHVVEMLDYGFLEDERPFIVFELLRGRSLFAAIKRLGAFDPLRVGRIAMQILDALDAAHGSGIIHRDIKPGNIYLCAGHEDDYAQLLDLGLAKALEGDGVETETITGTGYRLGTPRYMSPEMARGDVVGPQGDIYAVGLVMGEMIMGVPVVQGNVQIDVLMAHGGDDPLTIDARIRDSPFGRVVERALLKPLDERYGSAQEMRADVERELAIHTRTMEVAQLVGSRPGTFSDELATLNYDRVRHLDLSPARPSEGSKGPRGRAGTVDLSPNTPNASGDDTAELPPEVMAPDEMGFDDDIEPAPTTERMGAGAVAADDTTQPRLPPLQIQPRPMATVPPPSQRPLARQRVTAIVLLAGALVVLLAVVGWLAAR